MQKIIKQEFEGERPLYTARDLILEDVVIHEGESALKETRNIQATGCRFEGRYPLWCCHHFIVRDCVFTEEARAALWYSDGLEMSDCRVDAPKTFREIRDANIQRVRFTNAQETFWHCRDLELHDIEARDADYIFMHSHDIQIRHLHFNGKYSFQWASNIEIHDSLLNTKDAFWETDNVTVVDSEINGEYLGWHSRNLHFIRCHITGSQPLCYAENLVLEDCTFGADADLAFEYSSVRATIRGHIPSVKNPRTGCIHAGSIGEILLDEHIKQPGDCTITQG